MFKKSKKGFTLIELLVVVAIISLLSSVVFASLNSAREKSRLSALKQQMTQLRSAIELNYSSSVAYGNFIINSWIFTQAGCTEKFGSPAGTVTVFDPVAAAQILPICKNIVSLANKSDSPNNYSLLIGNAVGGGPADINRYSINVYSRDGATNGSDFGNLYCMGSSGTTFAAIPYDTPGCYYNP